MESRYYGPIISKNNVLVVLWFVVASVLVTWDAFFVLMRPRSMPGGDLHFIWKPYALYAWIDTRYADMEDTFGLAQTWLNLVEVCLNLATLTLLLKKNKGALLCGFFVCSLTFWKTTIYMLQYTELCNGAHLVDHVNWIQFLFLFLIPNGCWLVFPASIILYYGYHIQRIVRNHKEKTN